MMQNKNSNHTIHQKVEHFFRSPVCMYAVLILMLLAILKTDSKLFGMMREAYAQGFGMIGMYMREETTRAPINFGLPQRVIAVSGR